MIARIHHTKHGTEYVLQYTCITDTIELRINKYTFIGGIPNYFRHERGKSFLEIPYFKEILRNSRTISGIDQFPELTEDEEALIHAFEEVSDNHLLLTPESVRRFQLSSMAEMTRSMRSLDLQTLISAASRLADNLVQEFAVTSHVAASHLARFSSRNADGSEVTEPETDTEQEQNTLTEAEAENIRQQLQPDEGLRVNRYEAEHIAHTGSPPPTDEPPIAQETPSVNTEGLTEEQIQENLAFVARLLNGETISARDNPPLPNPNSEDASTPDPNTTEIDDLLIEIDETLSDTTRDSDEVWGAPTHTPYLDADTMSQLWKQAQKATSITPQNVLAPSQDSDDAG